jgi:hypothetical protein
VAKCGAYFLILLLQLYFHLFLFLNLIANSVLLKIFKCWLNLLFNFMFHFLHVKFLWILPIIILKKVIELWITLFLYPCSFCFANHFPIALNLGQSTVIYGTAKVLTELYKHRRGARLSFECLFFYAVTNFVL